MYQRTTEKGLNSFIETAKKIITSDLKLEKKTRQSTPNKIFFSDMIVCADIYMKNDYNVKI